jgi:hypothetical protein
MKYLKLFENFNGYSDEELKDIASKYRTKTDFQRLNRNAYQASIRRGKEFHNFITSHMVNEPIRLTNIKYSDKELEEAAKKYDTKGDFIKGDFHKYHASKKRGLDFFNRITAHMNRVIREPYTEKELMDIAKNYKTRSAFQFGNPSAYQAAVKKDYFNDITKHMPIPKTYTKEEIEATAKKYKNKQEFKNDPAYYAAYRIGKDYFQEITKHMRSKWNEPDIKQELLRWGNLNDIINNSPGLYNYLMKHPDLYHKYLDNLPQY